MGFFGLRLSLVWPRFRLERGWPAQNRPGSFFSPQSSVYTARISLVAFAHNQLGNATRRDRLCLSDGHKPHGFALFALLPASCRLQSPSLATTSITPVSVTLAPRLHRS